MHRLPAADHIIALAQDGRIIEQGNFKDLCARGGYVQQLNVSASHARNMDAQEDESQGDSDLQDEPKPSQKAQDQQDEEEEMLSDWSVFGYYFRAIRLRNFFFQVVLIAAQAVIQIFRCQYNPQITNFDID